MADVVETLTTFNKTLTAVNAIMSPGGALSLAISGIRAAIENRRKKGEQVKDLLVEVEALEQALFSADESIKQYWKVPPKPASAEK